MESKQKGFVVLTVVLAVVGVGLLVAAFATDNWVTASPHRETTNSTTRTQGQGTNTGNSTFGLFNGQQSINYGSGPRTYSLKAVCDAGEGLCAYIFMRPGVTAKTKLQELISAYKGDNGTGSSGYEQIEYGLFSFPLWVSTIVFLSLSIVMGLVTIGFSFFNIFGRPIETITGPAGLFLWNGLSMLFVIVTLAVFGALFASQLSKNYLLFDDYSTDWRSKDRTDLDFSFFFVVGAGAAFLLNFVFLCLSGQSLHCSYSGSGEKEVDNGMILY